MKNQTIIQFFHWYYSAEGNLWLHAKDEADKLARLGMTHVWLPPAYKSARGIFDPGYAVYDLYDLGEFDQQGTVRTVFGTKEEYIDCIRALQEKGLKVVADIVLNHRTGADEQEKVPVRSVNEENRLEFTSEVHEAELYTKFTFPGRNNKYSDFVWDWHAFTGACENGHLVMIMNEHSNGTWENVLDDQYGNYDYLLGNDIEFRNPAVREELKRWVCWYIEQTGIDGFRLDALKHITPDFFPEWLDHAGGCFQREFYCIGEYWKNDVGSLLHYIDVTQGRISLFDVPLHFNFYEASHQNENFDLRQIFDNTLMAHNPDRAITFVDNHDTQPLQSLQSTVEWWFKPLAYAFILLRTQGTPCVFYPALYEARYLDHNHEGEEVFVELVKIPTLEVQLQVRDRLAYGEQRDYFDDPNVVGWTREGIDENEHSGIAVLLSNKDEGSKVMSMGPRNAGKTFYDCCGNRNETVTLNEAGEGEFFTHGRSVSVWIRQDAGEIREL